jgi:hypothetical protein
MSASVTEGAEQATWPAKLPRPQIEVLHMSRILGAGTSGIVEEAYGSTAKVAVKIIHSRNGKGKNDTLAVRDIELAAKRHSNSVIKASSSSTIERCCFS